MKMKYIFDFLKYKIDGYCLEAVYQKRIFCFYLKKYWKKKIYSLKSTK